MKIEQVWVQTTVLEDGIFRHLFVDRIRSVVDVLYRDSGGRNMPCGMTPYLKGSQSLIHKAASTQDLSLAAT